MVATGGRLTHDGIGRHGCLAAPQRPSGPFGATAMATTKQPPPWSLTPTDFFYFFIFYLFYFVETLQFFIFQKHSSKF
jgi:hypothetical protein